MCSTTPNPSRSRRRARKPKYASLRNRLATPIITTLPPQQDLSMVGDPLQPDGDPQVACLLEQVDETEGDVTMLFGASTSSSAAFEEVSPSPVSSSVDWDGDRLARRALRGRERWVFCRSTTSSTVDLLGSGVPTQRLSLKLDYEEILTAWSDKGSLYINGEGPQIVPDLQQIYPDDCTTPSVFIEVGNIGSIVSVPEMEVDQQEDGGKGEMNRKERVIRYKEKRQSRLFSKRIRYEVRKLNAEKRPRVKGRFVKRNDDMIGSSLLENKRK